MKALVERLVEWAERTLPARIARRFFAVDGIDRTFTLAAHAFMAIFPLMIVVGTMLSRATGSSFGDTLIHKFRLTGSSAEAVHQVFNSTSSARASLGAVGILLLTWSGLGFVRTLQRMYATIWEVPVLGMRGTQKGLRWLVLLVLYISCSTLLRSVTHSHPDLRWVVVGPILVLTFAFWLISSHVLVGWAVGWRRLIPGASVATVALTVVNIGSTYYMPHMINTYDRRYGAVGITIAIIAYLAAVSFVVLASAVIGAELAGVPQPPPRHRGLRGLLQGQGIADLPDDPEPAPPPEEPARPG